MAGRMPSPTAPSSLRYRSAAVIRTSRCFRRMEQRSRLRVPVIGTGAICRDRLSRFTAISGNLMAVRFDPEQHSISGVPVAIAKGIQTATGFGVLGRTGFSVSRTGTLAWLRASPDDGRSRLVRVERDGKASPLSISAHVFQTPRLSPDGRRLALVVRSGIMTREIRIVDAARPERVTMTIAGGDNQSPAWMDNRRLAFGSNRDGLQKIYVGGRRQNAAACAAFHGRRDRCAKSRKLVAATAVAGALRDRACARARRPGLPRRRVDCARGGDRCERAFADSVSRWPMDRVRGRHVGSRRNLRRRDSIDPAKRFS